MGSAGVSQEAIAIWGLAVSILGLALTFVIRSPKELHGQLEKRVDQIEDDHNGLAKIVARLEAIVERLERTVAELSRARNGIRR